jgi:hypothetical protein
VSEPVFRTLPALTEGVAPQSPTVAGQPLSAQRDVPDAAPPEVESPDPAVPDAAVPEVESPDVANARGEDVSTVTPPVQRLVAADPPSGDRARHSAPQPPSRTAPDPPVQRTLQAPLPHAAAPTSQGPPPPSPAEQARAPRPSAPTQVQRTTAPTPDDSAPSRPVDSTPFSPMTTPAASSPAANQPVASAPLIGTTPQRAPVQRAPVQRVSAQHSPAPATPVTTRPHVSAPHASGPLADKSPTSASSAPPEQARSEHAQPMSVQRIEASPAVKLGLGAPLERPPAPATRIETVSLQEWAAARAQPPTVQRAIPAHEPTGPAPADRHIEAVADAPIPPATSRIAFPASTTDAPTANPPVAQRLVGEPQQIATQTVTSAVDARGDTETEAHSTSRVSTAEPGRATAPAPTSTPRVQRFAQPEPAAAAPGVAAQDAGSIAVAAGIAHRDADGSVTFDTPATHGTSATHDTTVQRAVDVDEMTAAGAPEPTTQPATAAAPHPAPATANIEDLARRLYDPLAARLKAELRLDRERFGLVTDLYR